MGSIRNFITAGIVCASACLGSLSESHAQGLPPIVLPEQRSIDVTRPPGIPSVQLPYMDAPPVPSSMTRESVERLLSLDDAIRIALENSEVVRILGGVTATTSGQTIYSVPTANTAIDQAQGRFDPTVSVNNTFNQFDTPGVAADPLDPTNANLIGQQRENYGLDFNFSKTNLWGGTSSMRVRSNPTYAEFGFGRPLLNPIDNNSVEMQVVQPLLQGAGRAANEAPIVIARINTERSFFQYKDSVQELVRGVAEAYWSLVFARTDLWARERQVEQAQFALDYISSRREQGFDNIADQSQAEVALYNFQATLLSSQTNVLQREEALRNLLGLPIDDGLELIPTTPPRIEKAPIDWNEIVQVAERNRPDIIELKLVMEADQQSLIQSENQARPRLDAVALYRWNGLEGILPDGSQFMTEGGQFTDWTLGINFSVPIGLRQARAGVRQQELILARDRANLEQGIHNMIYTLSFNYRNADLLYSQYELFRKTRQAALTNLQGQGGRYRADLVIFLNVLQAITDWGNSVSSEAQALTQYNTQLATLERQTGTILETHGIRFYEERFGFAGPLRRDVLYPATMRPTENWERYEAGDRPSEEAFDLDVPKIRNLNEQLQRPEVPNLEQQGPVGQANLSGTVRFLQAGPTVRHASRIETTHIETNGEASNRR